MHNICRFICDDTEKAKKNVVKHIDEYVDEEGSELYSNIRFINSAPLADIDEADKKIDELDTGAYDQLAVRFYDYEKPKETKKLINARKKMEDANENSRLLRQKLINDFLKAKSKQVTCKKCDSKLTRSYLRTCTCPVCSSNLLSDNSISRIENANKKHEDLQNAYQNLYKEESKKGKRSIKWRIKIEYHT